MPSTSFSFLLWDAEDVEKIQFVKNILLVGGFSDTLGSMLILLCWQEAHRQILLLPQAQSRDGPDPSWSFPHGRSQGASPFSPGARVLRRVCSTERALGEVVLKCS